MASEKKKMNEIIEFPKPINSIQWFSNFIFPRRRRAHVGCVYVHIYRKTGKFVGLKTKERRWRGVCALAIPLKPKSIDTKSIKLHSRWRAPDEWMIKSLSALIGSTETAEEFVCCVAIELNHRSALPPRHHQRNGFFEMGLHDSGAFRCIQNGSTTARIRMMCFGI